MGKLYADPGVNAANLKRYAASAALKNAEGDAKRAHDRNHMYRGDVMVRNPTAIKADTNGQVPYVMLSSCLDISRWEVLDAKSRKPVSLPPNRLTKYVILSTLERWPEGWRVTRDEPQNKSC
ncbi:secreted protein/lipoprotein [Streptomyces sp. CBMA152]|nr:secreted protein/lipoprotein [Streptomyces sp. CBMA152]